jgi:hypothetical protein
MIKQLLYALGLILITATFFSCNDRPATQPPPVATGKFNFGVLRYDSAALEYRLDSIHNRGLILQFVLRESGDNNTAFQLISYAFDTLNDYNNSWIPDTLGIIQDSVPKTFTGKISVGNNEITREILLNAVRDTNGNRFPYDYVQFTPVVEGVFMHVVYMMKTVKNGKETELGLRQMSTPMPPARNW